jgi:hypothetical protein
MEPFHLKQAGAKWWHSEDHASPSLSKASLGTFLYHVLKTGAHIGSIWPFAPQYNRSPVYFTVFMTDEMKEQIEKETKVKFRPPPIVSFN